METEIKKTLRLILEYTQNVAKYSEDAQLKKYLKQLVKKAMEYQKKQQTRII